MAAIAIRTEHATAMSVFVVRAFLGLIGHLSSPTCPANAHGLDRALTGGHGELKCICRGMRPLQWPIGLPLLDIDPVGSTND